MSSEGAVRSAGALRIAVVGGGGHVGLPLSLVLADRGYPVVVVDSDEQKLALIASGTFPFLERDGDEFLGRVLRRGSLVLTSDHACVKDCHVIIVTVGTPIDEHLNPNLAPIYACIEQVQPYLHSGHVIVMRSTLFPGTSNKIYERLQAAGLDVGVSFCPERIVEGRALVELPRIPQIVSATDERTLAIVKSVFSSVTPEVVELGLTEAEVAKLFSNAWRYVKFAVANQFYVMSTQKGLDFYRIRDAMMRGYERAVDFPSAGFTAGPCLFKDTMQLAAFDRQHFMLGHAAMLMNETLPESLVEEAKRFGALAGRRVGILGMAFKADSDDPRESLAYKLRRLLRYEGAQVLCTDPFVRDPSLSPLEVVLDHADLLFVGCPHAVYRSVNFEGRCVIDCWGLVRSRP